VTRVNNKYTVKDTYIVSVLIYVTCNKKIIKNEISEFLAITMGEICSNGNAIVTS